MPNNTRQPRKFGIEIECFNVREVPSILLEKNWIIGHDGSIRGNNAYEFKSPPLPATAASFREVKQVMKALREAGVRVNRSCGMHVHVGVENDVRTECVPGLFFANLIERYNMLEPYIDLLVPPSRRGNTNQYCHSMNQYCGTGIYASNLVSLREIEAVHERLNEYASDNNQEVYNFLARNPVQSRIANTLYSFGRGKMNIGAYLRHGTVEFRQFGSTLNGTKAVSWIKFCLAFTNTCSKASRRDLEQRVTFSPEQWNNPLLGMRRGRATEFLTARHDSQLAGI